MYHGFAMGILYWQFLYYCHYYYLQGSQRYIIFIFIFFIRRNFSCTTQHICGTSILLSLSSSDSLDNSESLAVTKSIISLIFIFSIQHILVSSSNIKKIIYSKIDYYFWHKYSLIFIMTPYGVIHFQKIICKWGNKLCLQSLH